jgi:hypothetical protein
MAARTGDRVFPGQRAGRPLSRMAFEMLSRRFRSSYHRARGFRGAFRDWAGSETHFPRELVDSGRQAADLVRRRGETNWKSTRPRLSAAVGSSETICKLPLARWLCGANKSPQLVDRIDLLRRFALWRWRLAHVAKIRVHRHAGCGVDAIGLACLAQNRIRD